MKVSLDGHDAANQVQLLDDSGAPVEVVTQFLRHLSARGCSPNTVSSYAFDLLHLWRFLAWLRVAGLRRLQAPDRLPTLIRNAGNVCGRRAKHDCAARKWRRERQRKIKNMFRRQSPT